MNDERFSISGWEDDFLDIDESRNPVVLQNNGQTMDLLVFKSDVDKLQHKILEACEKGNLETVKSLIEQSPDLINATDKDKYTPLHRACYSNHVDIVMYLIQKGANIAAKTELKWEPLHSCCQWNNKECAAALIQNGADVNAETEGKQTPLHIAASHGTSYDTVQLLLMHPFIDPNIKNNSGEKAADIAKRSSRYYKIFEMVDPLIDVKDFRCLK